jgi:hypothetical protein
MSSTSYVRLFQDIQIKQSWRLQFMSPVINRFWSCDWHFSYTLLYEIKNVPCSRKPAFPFRTIVSHHKSQIAVCSNCLWELCIVYVPIVRTVVRSQEYSRTDFCYKSILFFFTAERFIVYILCACCISHEKQKHTFKA